jgi:hypothetical protein
VICQDRRRRSLDITDSLHRLDGEVREDSIRRVTVDPELGPGTLSVTPLHDVSESGLAQRSVQRFEIVEKRAKVTVEEPIDPFAAAFRFGGDQCPKGVIVCRIGLGNPPAIGSDDAKRTSRSQQSIELTKHRRARLDGEAVENVVREDRGAAPVVERQWASKIAPEIHRTARPAIHVDPSRHHPIATSEVEQEPPLSAVGVGSSSPPGMETISQTHGPESHLAMNALEELDRNRGSLDKTADGVPFDHRAPGILRKFES